MPSRTILVEVNRYDAFLHGRGQADSEEETEKREKKKGEEAEEEEGEEKRKKKQRGFLDRSKTRFHAISRATKREREREREVSNRLWRCS